LHDKQAGGADEGGDGCLDLLAAEDRDRTSIIGNSVKHSATGDDRNANRVDLRAEQIGAVAGRIEPALIDRRYVGPESDILFDKTEVCAGVLRTNGEIGLAAVLVGDRPFNYHPLAVQNRGRRES